MTSRIRPILAMVTISFRAAPARAALTMLLFLFGAITRPLFAVLLGYMANNIGNGASGNEIALGALLLGATIGISLIVSELGWKVGERVQEEATHHIDRQMLTTVMGVSGIEHHERPEYIDKLDRLRQEYWLLSQALTITLTGLQILVQVAISIAILGGITPWLLLLPVFAIPQLLANNRAMRMRIKGMEEVQPEWRKSDDAVDLIVTPGSAKEVRVFGLGEELLARHARSSRNSFEREFGDTIRGARWIAAGRFIFSLAFIGAIGVVTNLVVTGQEQPGSLITAITLAGSILQMITSASQQLAFLDYCLQSVRRYLWLIDYGKEHASTAIEESPERLKSGIRFENVAFRYPDTTNVVLGDVDFFIPAGSTVAVIGDNGAGKSTLIKLLTRMYEPTSGRILIDDQPLSNIEPGQWRAQSSAAFQDHARFELPAQESVGVGDMPAREDRQRVENAVASGGASDVIARLPSGYDTQLGAMWSGGVDLSGGQWQKLALARGMMRDPLLLVLDEPTSALDAETEHALFERFATAAQTRAAGSGTVTILVSHRFSTVRMADIIVVLSNGKVAESGSHADLMAKKGLYAELYELQARAYR